MTIELVTIPNVELAAVGDWPTEKGWGRFTADDLEAMAVHAERAEGGFRPRIKLGHGSTGIGAVPAWGRVENVRVEGDKLLGDLTHVPAPLAAVMPSALPGRSIEAVRGRKDAAGSTIPMVMTGLALLGVEEPAIDTLADLHAAQVGETELVIHAAASLAGMTVDEFQRSVREGVDSAGETTTTEDAIVPDKDSTATDDAAAKAAADEAAATKAAEEKAAADAEAAKADDEAKAAQDAADAAAKLPDNVIPVDRAVWEATQKRIEQLETTAEEQVAASRDTFLDAAIGAGKFDVSQRDTYADLLAKAPDSTRALIDAMPEQTIPVHAERGHQGTPDQLADDKLDEAYAATFAQYDRNAQEG